MDNLKAASDSGQACAQRTARTWATRQEIRAAVELDAEQRGLVRMRIADREWNVWQSYGHLRKREAIGGDGTTSSHQIIEDLYGPKTFQEKRGLRRTVKRSLEVLERQGLIAVTQHRTLNGGGKCLGLRVELLEVPKQVTERSQMPSIGYQNRRS